MNKTEARTNNDRTKDTPVQIFVSTKLIKWSGQQKEAGVRLKLSLKSPLLKLGSQFARGGQGQGRSESIQGKEKTLAPPLFSNFNQWSQNLQHNPPCSAVPMTPNSIK